MEFAVTILKGLFTLSSIKAVGGAIAAQFTCDSMACRGEHIVRAATNIALSEGAEAMLDITCDGCGQQGQAKVTASGPSATSGSSDCFIASAVYQDLLHPDIVLFRAYRDDVMMASPLGRHLVRWYCDRGPMAARWIARRPVFRSLIRVNLAFLAAALRACSSPDSPGSDGLAGPGSRRHCERSWRKANRKRHSVESYDRSTAGYTMTKQPIGFLRYSSLTDSG